MFDASFYKHYLRIFAVRFVFICFTISIIGFIRESLSLSILPSNSEVKILVGAVDSRHSRAAIIHSRFLDSNFPFDKLRWFQLARQKNMEPLGEEDVPPAEAAKAGKSL